MPQLRLLQWALSIFAKGSLTLRTELCMFPVLHILVVNQKEHDRDEFVAKQNGGVLQNLSEVSGEESL